MVTYEDVNAGMAKVVEYLKSIEDVWGEIRNLKLHYAFGATGKILEQYPLVKEKYEGREADPYYDFCKEEYDYFVEWMKEEGIKDERDHIGRTSSFYLTNLYDRNFEYVLAEAIDKAAHGFGYLDFDENGKVEKLGWGSYSEEELLEEAQPEMEYVANGEFLEDVQNSMADAIAIAEYIDGFKKNQVEAFEEYISNINDEILWEIDRENEKKIQLNMATMACYI